MSARLLKGGFNPATEPLNIPSLEPGSVIETAARQARHQGVGASLPNQLQERADHAINEASIAAERLITAAQANIAKIENEARERGLQDARAQMEKDLQAAVADLRAQMVSSLNELDQLYTVIAARVEKDLVKLAMEIARKVVQRAVTTDPDITMTLARIALERLHPRAAASVRLNPDDFEYVTANREKLGSSCTLELISDPSIARGGCLIQSDHGDVDARIDQQFNAIERGFFEG